MGNKNNQNVYISTKKKSSLCAPTLTDLLYLETYLRLNDLYTDSIEQANAVLIHTCAFTRVLEDEAIKTIKDIRRQANSSATLIVIGCLPAINARRLWDVHGGIALSQNQLEKLDEILNVRIGFSQVKYADCLRQELLDDDIPDYPLRVGWGCLGNCSYCSIKNVFGRPRSRPIVDIVKEVENGLARGFNIFYLVANEIGCYGYDIDTRVTELIEAILTVDPAITLRLSSYLPNQFLHDFPWLENYLTAGRIDYLYIACQSGSDDVLRLMNRPYSTRDFAECVLLSSRTNPRLQIRSDFIVGFPGETEDDFQQTLRLVDRLAEYPLRLQIIPFSPRPKTAAETMTAQVGQKVIMERHRRLSFVLCQLQKLHPMLEHLA